MPINAILIAVRGALPKLPRSLQYTQIINRTRRGIGQALRAFDLGVRTISGGHARQLTLKVRQAELSSEMTLRYILALFEHLVAETARQTVAILLHAFYMLVRIAKMLLQRNVLALLLRSQAFARLRQVVRLAWQLVLRYDAFTGFRQSSLQALKWLQRNRLHA